jgi:hypothetical protein
MQVEQFEFHKKLDIERVNSIKDTLMKHFIYEISMIRNL